MTDHTFPSTFSLCLVLCYFNKTSPAHVTHPRVVVGSRCADLCSGVGRAMVLSGGLFWHRNQDMWHQAGHTYPPGAEKALRFPGSRTLRLQDHYFLFPAGDPPLPMRGRMSLREILKQRTVLPLSSFMSPRSLRQ